VRAALAHAVAEHARYLVFCKLDDFETWEDEVEYHGWLKTEEVLTALAAKLGLPTDRRRRPGLPEPQGGVRAADGRGPGRP
jgi:hypothetical protein